MEKYNTDKVFVTDNKANIKGCITAQMLLNFKSSTPASEYNKYSVEDVLEEGICFISVYPQNNIIEVLNTMKELNIKYLPVCKSPTDKKLLGFIKNNKIKISEKIK